MPQFPPPLGLCFGPSFYSKELERAAATPQIVRPESAARAAASRISYSAERYNTVENFAAHEDFAVFKAQFEEGIEKLKGFCREYKLANVEKLCANFDLLKKNRFAPDANDLHFFVGDHLKLLDGPGKCALDEMLVMLDDPAIDIRDKERAVLNLSEGVAACAPGAGANMILAHRALSLSAGGLPAAVWQAKEAIVEAVIAEAVIAKFGHEASFAGMETHYGNAVRDHLAARIGLPLLQDSLAPRNLTLDFLNACGANVARALKPVKLALHLAEECHARTAEKFADSGDRASGHEESLVAVYSHNKDSELLIDEAMTEARMRYGDSVQRLSLVQDSDNYQTFSIQPEHALLAADILWGLQEQKLLRQHELLLSPAFTQVASWIDPDDEVPARVTAHCAENKVLWLVRSYDENDLPFAQDASGLLSAAKAQRELFNVRLARQLHDRLPADPVRAHQRRPSYRGELWGEADASRPPLARMPSQGQLARPTRSPLIARAELQAIHATDPEQLMQVDPAWLTRDRAISAFFSRLGPERSTRYLSDHAPHFIQQLRFDRNARAELVDCALDALVEVPGLTQALYSPNPWNLTGEYRTGTGLSRLAYAMHEGSARDVEALARHHEQTAAAGNIAAPGPDDAANLYTLLATNQKNVKGLTAAMALGKCEHIHAWRRILMSPGALGAPASTLLQKSLTALLLATDTRGTDALAYAAARNRAAAITAWGELIRQPEVLEHIKGDLPRLLNGVDGGKMPALGCGATRGFAGVITALGDVLRLPEILIHIKDHLPDLLKATSSSGRQALGLAACIGSAAVIRAWRDVVLSDEIRPHIREKLPEMLEAKSGVVDTSALWDASRYGHAEAIAAFGELFLSPKVLPHVEGHLARLLTGEAAEDNPNALGTILRKGDVECLRAYLEVIEAAVPHLTDEEIKRILSPGADREWPSHARLFAGNAAVQDCRWTLVDFGLQIDTASRNAAARRTT